VREREAFGQHVSKFSNVQDWIAKSRVAIDQARLLLLQTAWRLDQTDCNPRQLRSDVAAVKVVTAQLQTQVVDRAIQMFGAMGLSPDTPLAYFWSWGRAMHLMDGPDAVHLRTIARYALRQSATQAASLAAYFTTPEQLRAPPQIR
jgi:acyl-CoA dehydrogenase